ncbi:MAG TPA: rhodanese-like domain-containing protein [Candidatus Dependentiae bacterium]|nr:rhodanese-like domain-containing protein [Candidatus Dependentiae bacterium]HRQ62680.1 rhodanese-like domain-containing protein [Candidatus Dependentiae bacterium]
MNKTLKLLSIYGVLACLVILSGCGKPHTEKLTGLVVINVLDKQLYDDCHIKGSISIPFEQLTEEIEKKVDKNAEVILYCSNYMCASSGYGCRKLTDLGYTNVSVYEGGTAEWFQENLPVEGPAHQKYLQRKLTPPEHVDDTEGICVITVDELAAKLGCAK